MTAIVRTLLAGLVGILFVEARIATDAGNPSGGTAIAFLAAVTGCCVLAGVIRDEAAARRAARRADRWRARARDANAANATLRESSRAWRRLAEDRGRALEAVGVDLDDAVRATRFGPALDDIRSLPDTPEKTR